MIKEVDQILENTGMVTEYSRMYIDKQKRLLKLDIAEKSAKVGSSLITTVALALVVSFLVLFLSVTVAFSLGALWESYALGFLAVTGFYLLVTFVILVFKRNLITNPVLNAIVKNFLED